jgi:hypothetical protein
MLHFLRKQYSTIHHALLKTMVSALGICSIISGSYFIVTSVLVFGDLFVPISIGLLCILFGVVTLRFRKRL